MRCSEPGHRVVVIVAPTGDHFWISGPKRDGGDALYGGSTPVEIDDAVREKYWRDIRRR